ncbi:hypothetical protein V1478_013578 [Vespula squamosa]|uniref:Uncharacterized protein n=1 Tax=Vespula squamosa TaxID=30214 RepID=A0ABD2A5X0_VESSQ
MTTNFDETNTALFYKDLFEWWNEETGYRFQKIQNPSFYTLKRSRHRFRQEDKINIDYNADSALGYQTNDNLDSTCLENT